MITSAMRPRREVSGRGRSPKRAMVLVAGLLAAGSVIGFAAVPASAETPAPTVPGAPAAAVPGSTVPGSRTAVAQPPNAAPGASVTVAGTGWPAGAVVVANICGNAGLNAATDCTPTPAGQNIAGPDGAVSIPVVVAAPAQPCPCVIRLSVAGDPTTSDAALTIDGATTAPPVVEIPQSSVDVNARISGSGPLSAYLGGAAERTVIVSVTNTGTAPLINPVLVLTFGKGQEPTEALLGPGGQAPALGTIAPGQTVEYQQPVTIDAPAFGQYRLLGRFEGIATVSVDGVPQAQPTFTATTSSYPWLLIVGGWLLLQIPLLGLYKRRPVIIEPANDDPYRDSYADLDAAAPAVPAAAMAAPVMAANAPVAPPAPQAVSAPAPAAVPSAPPLPAGFQLIGTPEATPPAPEAPAPEPQPAAPASPEGAPNRVFGVDDLRSMLDG